MAATALLLAQLRLGSETDARVCLRAACGLPREPEHATRVHSSLYHAALQRAAAATAAAALVRRGRVGADTAAGASRVGGYYILALRTC